MPRRFSTHALAKNLQKGIVRKAVLVGEALGGDGLDPCEESLVDLVAPAVAVEGVIGELVVVAVVAKDGGIQGKLRKSDWFCSS